MINMTERNIMGSGKSRIKILPLEDVLMTPEQIEEERRKEAEKRAGKPTTSPKSSNVNPTNVIVPGKYEIYSGRNVDKVPEILDAGKIIAPFFYIADKRINAKSEKDIETWADKWFDVSDLILYNDKNNAEDIKIVLAYDAKYNLTSAGESCLKLIHPHSTLISGGIDISGEYSSVSGDGVIPATKSELAEELETGLAKTKTKNSKLWRQILRHPDEVGAEFAIPGLHEEYINWVYSAYGSRFAKEQNIDELKLMGVYLASPQNVPHFVPHLRAWYVYGLKDRSSADGGYDLDYAYGRLVGISARGAGRARQKGGK